MPGIAFRQNFGYNLPMWKKILLTLALAAAAAFCIGIAVDSHPLRLVTKGIPVATLLVLLAAGSRNRYSLLLMAGLAFSLAGDLLLELPGDYFVPGLTAFLVGHLFYNAAFLLRSRRLLPLRLLPLLAWAVAIFLLLAPRLGEFTLPVLVYVCVLFTMMWRAAALPGTEGISRNAALLALGGALLFGLSDSLLAIGRFLGPYPWLDYPVILTYWLAQTGIALSAQRDR